MRPLLGIVLLAGCAAPAPAPALRDFRAVIHVHSSFSHDSEGRMEEILAAAKKLAIDVVCMTEHPQKGADPARSLREGWSGLRDGVLFIQGLELRHNLLAIGISRMPAGEGPQGVIDDIHAQGGIAIVSHPEEVKAWDFDRFDGMEIWNTHAAMKEALDRKDFLPRVAKRLKEQPDLLFLELLAEPLDNLARWSEIRASRPCAMIAGNDSHQNVDFFGRKLDPYERSLGFVTTHVMATELTPCAILEAIRAGRTYVQFEILGSGPGSLGGAKQIDRGRYTASFREGRPWIYRPAD
jgi:hypothetical protein